MQWIGIRMESCMARSKQDDPTAAEGAFADEKREREPDAIGGGTPSSTPVPGGSKSSQQVATERAEKNEKN